MRREDIDKIDRVRPMPDWLRDALSGKSGTKIVPLNKAAGAKRNLSIGEINKLILGGKRLAMDKLICSICSQSIPFEGPDGAWKYGHNAAPVTPERCCGLCNDTYVVPIRIAMLFAPKLAAKKLKLLQKNIAIDKAIEAAARRLK